jgi:hypothetical protein
MFKKNNFNFAAVNIILLKSIVCELLKEDLLLWAVNWILFKDFNTCNLVLNKFCDSTKMDHFNFKWYFFAYSKLSWDRYKF